MSGGDRLWLVLFFWVTERPRLVMAAGLLLIACGAAAGGLWLVKDTSADSLVGQDNPARKYKAEVTEVFGLTDPVAIAVTAINGETIYRRDVLALIDELSRALEQIRNVDSEQVVSLATQKLIVAEGGGIRVHPLLERADGTPADPAEVEAGIAAMPLYRGSLVARDGSATLILAGLIDAQQASNTYQRILALARRTAVPSGVTLHVAGDGAVSGYLATYIERDAFRLTPAATVVIGLILLVAFRALAGALLPTLIIAGTLSGAISLMVFTSTPFYVITNGLLVNLIGIAVADAIHVLTAYRRLAQTHQHEDRQQLVCRTMLQMWRPITLTTLTTVAGFVALGLSTDMAPVTAFGFLGAAGVTLAWLFSMTLLPASMVLIRPPAPRLITNAKRIPPVPADLVSDASALAELVLRRPTLVVTLSAALAGVGLLGASRVEVNDAWIDNFDPTEPLYVADKVINERMDGVNYMDIVVEATEPEGLLRPTVLRRIEALEVFLLGQPHVNGATSIVGYIKQMNKAMHGDDPAAYLVPERADTVAQLLLLYGFSADPTDLDERIDPLRQTTLVRVAMDRSVYRTNDVVIPAVQHYLNTVFNTATLTGTATGRVVVDYTWVKSIADTHLRSLGLALLAVLGICLLMFRSAVTAALAMTPVLMAVLMVYAVMGLAGIPLGVGTAMFAAIAIGLGVDFAIHALLRLRDAMAGHGDVDRAIRELYPTTGRALTCNCAAVALGFGVLLASSTPPLRTFGLLVAVAIGGAFLASVSTLPALFRLWQGSRTRNSSAAALAMPPSEIRT